MQRRSKIIDADRIAVRFSGDSGDGMQLTGSLFSLTTAAFGNDISTFPDFPADIRAPQGTISGVSGFQVHFGKGVCTPGDLTDVLVAMNPAALKANVNYMSPGGTIIMDVDNFDKKNLEKAGYLTNDPIIEDKLQGFNIVKAPITSLSQECTKDLKLDRKSILRSKNMYALGLINWMFNRPIDYTRKYIRHKFSHKPDVMEANLRILETGFNYGNIIQAGTPSYHITTSEPQKGFYRNLSGNKAVAWGFLLAADKSGLQLFLGSYPITPSTEILQELAGRKDLGVKVFQAEDEIAAISSAIGASYAGALGITNTSGPGLSLKSEALGLAVMAEVPLVVVNVQRGGPSTGLPTKTEQSDLMQALYGRNGESPLVVMAASTPVNCFDYAFYASKIALEHMIPVILLTDSFLANGSQQWKVPEEGDFPTIDIPRSQQEPGKFLPYLRNPEKLNRDWVRPGMEGYEHRIGSLEKDADTGAVSHDGPNHEIMVKLRQEKLNRVANFIPPLSVEGNPGAEVLVVGWGSTYGHLHTAIEELNTEGNEIAFAIFNYINPLPKNTEDILKKYKTIIVCELNMGQFATWLRNHFPKLNYIQYNKVQGLPFTIKELKEFFKKSLEEQR
ncbi:2-oxoacid:acceptor oxidoreductase subunit alpha [Alkalitalea saponilacus]|uniref:2-oxoglutarate ferredoxin oxidoreductase subunit alpha n=1 Tax=Alkalitalea saponilacus TaxID=889453 RepID=A0A1T5HTJ0_9BACT|nr:2-oxoacid:acceptor oxidoreductase subunit alpha [Alkalitalea saponilacus]ASB48525.1 2-oxoacid:acceptor oxidoreductase subunit alpha [Alkalitalea saponilacus]SKC23851.1 2-oxoglutarate ferredoxin oxidoreductase subunit alpha [Alkalitalea saponilacus]